MTPIKNSHGGKRKNSGRMKLKRPIKKFSALIYEDQLAWLETIGKPRSKILRGILDDAMKKRK